MATLTQLMYALAVDTHRNFRRAAKASFVSQPTLSMQLQKLEEELEVVLFDRNRKPVVPTREGKILLEQFRVVQREFGRIDEVVQEMRGKVAGPYRLGIIPTMAATILPRVVPGFVERYPDVQLSIEELTTKEIMARLAAETLDGGILATPLTHPQLSEFPLYCEEFKIFHSAQIKLPAGEDGKVELRALPSERLLVMQSGHCLRTQTLDLCSMGEVAGEARRFHLEAGSLQTLCAMVKAGPYFTVLPALAAMELESQGHGHLVKDIAGEVPYREIGLVTRRLENRRAIREALIAYAKTCLRPFESEGCQRRNRPTPPLEKK